MTIKLKFSFALLVLIFGFVTVATPFANAQDETATAKTETAEQSAEIEFELPADPEAVVVQYHVIAGFMHAFHEDFKPTTLLRVLGNGRVLVGRNHPSGTELEYSIEPAEVKALVNSLINEYGLLDITTEGIKQKMKDTGRKFFIGDDAPRYQITLNLVDKKHEVELRELIGTRNYYPDVADIQTFDKLNTMFMVMRAKGAFGTDEQIAEIKAAIEKKFKKQYTNGEKPLTIENIEKSYVDKDGKLFATLRRYDDNGDRAFSYYTDIQRSEKGKVKITIGRLPLPSKKQANESRRRSAEQTRKNLEKRDAEAKKNKKKKK